MGRTWVADNVRVNDRHQALYQHTPLQCWTRYVLLPKSNPDRSLTPSIAPPQDLGSPRREPDNPPYTPVFLSASSAPPRRHRVKTVRS